MPQKEIKQNHAPIAYFMATTNLFHIEPKPNIRAVSFSWGMFLLQHQLTKKWWQTSVSGPS